MTDWENYESGPFCRHWSDPCDCELDCAGCGHRCVQHAVGGATGCDECGCKAYAEPK